MKKLLVKLPDLELQFYVYNFKMHPCGLCGSPFGLCSSDRCECNIPTIVEFDHSEYKYNPSKGYF